MKSYRAIARQAPRLQSNRSSLRLARFYSSSPNRPKRPIWINLLGLAAFAGVVWQISSNLPKQAGHQRDDAADLALPKAPLEFEKTRKKAVSKEENRDLISSQHLQVKKSWENPGVYAWGSNAGRVIDPDSTENVVKTPRRITYFDGHLLRDLKLTQSFGAAVTENGDVVQWGTGFSKANPAPTPTLKGKDIVKVGVSADRVIALSSNGTVYSLPASKEDQEGGDKTKELPQSSWTGFWSSHLPTLSSLNYRNLTPSGLSRGEKVTDISSGLDHCLLLTSRGRVFSAASSTSDFPSKGQMGIPGLTWATRPPGAYDQPHEIGTLKGFNIAKIATGDYHSVVLDTDGRLFSFGDNTYGQLGFQPESGFRNIDAPSLLPVNKLYASTGSVPKTTSIAAGGSNTFFTVDVEPQAQPNAAMTRTKPPVSADLWACGHGVYGGLGNGKWTHVTAGPSKVKDLSGLFEFDEKNGKLAAIKLAYVSVGATHTSAVMDNVTKTSASDRTAANDTNWGADVLMWGGNEHFQLGTGRRTNANTPTYIRALDSGEADTQKGRKGEDHRLQITPRQTVRLGEGGKGRKVTLEQKVECGRFVTAVYSRT
jgi:alpha-tubulin suppressor-like RCC1 family protein